ncbi:hypothetical protein GBQ70_05085 [Halomicrobium sp. ZPS1]|uniref:DUF8098 domain-containing protein n=3 Tax=Haloarculaceae TaxID=1963268 RepID=C7NXQ9_HALMD|nr:hypothetical protein Hmuk_0360 [Halomicrobium mukohataei DSM 12286]QCD65044.1 hypothetical protein E5139_05090 [Halomicrobium mukohataei]QFR19850.1 hypothetical protein GBQ70_05085 [Halomicrobium sp. ZPS1]
MQDIKYSQIRIYGMLTSGDEESLLADIKEGIQYALFLGKERGRFAEEDIRLDKIRLNKLQYIVNEDRDLGLTFGWYKYGPAPEDVTSDHNASLMPAPGSEISHLEESRLPTRDSLSTEEFAYYFISELGEEFDKIVTAENTKEYLEDFYAKYAPRDRYAARYTDLYIASARLQQTLDKIKDDESWHEDSTHYYYELEKRFTPVINEVAKHEELEHTTEPLREYQKVLTSVIAEADAMEELSSGQDAFISNAVRKFYSTIWDFVAQEVSLKTMRGDNVDSLRPSVEATVKTYRGGSWVDELDSIRDRRGNSDLDPDREPSEPQGNSETEEQSIDESLLNAVSRTGVEAIKRAEGEVTQE